MNFTSRIATMTTAFLLAACPAAAHAGQIGQARALAADGLFLIDGGRVGALPGVTVHSFGQGPTDEGAAAHARMIAEIARDGLAPRVPVTLLEALPAVDYTARDRQVSAAIRYANHHGARVVNVSMGRPVRQPRTCRALRRAASTLFIVGAGNDGRDLGSYGFWPAVCGAPNMIVVGMTDETGARRSDSNYGAPVDLYAEATSTSEATVKTSVRAARLALAHPDASAAQLRAMALARF